SGDDPAGRVGDFRRVRGAGSSTVGGGGSRAISPRCQSGPRGVGRASRESSNPLGWVSYRLRVLWELNALWLAGAIKRRVRRRVGVLELPQTNRTNRHRVDVGPWSGDAQAPFQIPDGAGRARKAQRDVCRATDWGLDAEGRGQRRRVRHESIVEHQDFV